MTHNPFHTHIRTALANETLQAALDANAERRIRARITAFASLPIDRETLRQRAHAMRADVIANLDRYLDQFIDKAQGNGIIVHRAADAEEARQIVIDIARNSPQRAPGNTKESFAPLSGRKLIAKAKTMVSEEIRLNPALEAADIEVVETDLGEYIVQLRGEHPAHIITPAVHLRRGQVGETFHEKLGIPLTDDIPTLTDAARVALRQTFLDADIGISGVNMGVAESGSLCVLTNEGNGRMVTTLPRVHIALMGIERLVPDLDSLALILSMLPRSATGQKITVYTQLIHGPRRADETDGAKERHLILVDNGRSTLRRSPLNDVLMCIRCGACLNACPVFREIGGHAYVGNRGQYTPYPGPMGSVVSPGLFGHEAFGHLAQACTLCGACKEVCPIDIDLPGMLLRVRAGFSVQGSVSSIQYPVSSIQCSVVGGRRSVVGGRRPVLSKVEGSAVGKPGIGLPIVLRWGLGMFTWATTSPWRYALAQKLAAAFSWMLSPRSMWLRLPAITGWGYSKDFPRPAGKPFRERFESANQRVSESTSQRVNESASQRVNESANQRISESTKSLADLQTRKLADSLTRRFEAELTALSGTFTACTAGDLPKLILALLRERGITEIVAWEADHLPGGLAEALQRDGIGIRYGSHPEIRAGITGAVAGVAETGSIVITSGAGRPLTTSLLPEIHIAILDEKDIYENLPQVLNLQEVRDASCAALISGPSRTADIEMALTIGVHGPGEVHVFCVS